MPLIEQVHPTDISAFLKAEREEAILGLLEETKKETVESLTTRHWDNVMREWERDKARILSAVAGGGGGQGAGADMSELSLARDMSTSFVSRTRDTGVTSRGADTTLVSSSLSHHELEVVLINLGIAYLLIEFVL